MDDFEQSPSPDRFNDEYPDPYDTKIPSPNINRSPSVYSSPDSEKSGSASPQRNILAESPPSLLKPVAAQPFTSSKRFLTVSQALERKAVIVQLLRDMGKVRG